MGRVQGWAPKTSAQNAKIPAVRCHICAGRSGVHMRIRRCSAARYRRMLACMSQTDPQVDTSPVNRTSGLGMGGAAEGNGHVFRCRRNLTFLRI
jgi:hypothetical protein